MKTNRTVWCKLRATFPGIRKVKQRVRTIRKKKAEVVVRYLSTFDKMLQSCTAVLQCNAVSTAVFVMPMQTTRGCVVVVMSQ